jgi:hexosaminidase
VFAYAIDRDGKQPGDDTISTTDYSWMKRLDALAKSVDH